jgi:hypothetical protein
MFIHTNGVAVLTTWEENPDLDLLPTPIAGKHLIRVPKMMYVPVKYIKQFIRQRLTPRQLMEVIYSIQSWSKRSGQKKMQPFIQWMMACGVSTGTDQEASPVMLPDVKSPVADAQSFKPPLQEGIQRQTISQRAWLRCFKSNSKSHNPETGHRSPLVNISRPNSQASS